MVETIIENYRHEMRQQGNFAVVLLLFLVLVFCYGFIYDHQSGIHEMVSLVMFSGKRCFTCVTTNVRKILKENLYKNLSLQHSYSFPTNLCKL